MGAALFAGAVLLTGLPVSALLTQRQQLSTTSAELRSLQSADHQLSTQSRHLTDPATVQGMARSDYGMVPPGEKAYVILPPPGSSAAAVAGSGHVPLEGPPVAPGSALSQQLLGLPLSSHDGATGSTGSTGRSTSGASGHGSSGTSSGSGSFLSRVIRTLEFWR
ncbi:MAG TPA: septum formation initiator family protein [Acidimicrobiales bacterium]|nr:septum formation initiator family protein [Acidimicrobiales bacterium]